MRLIAEAIRGKCLENQHQGTLWVIDQFGSTLYSTPDSENEATFFRSAAKPFQAFPLVELPKANQGLDQSLLAIACASHVGSPAHVAQVRRLLRSANLEESCLQCGSTLPLERVHFDDVPNPIYHNCSGKHAGMLRVCKAQGWPVESYLDPEHPLQQHLVNRLQEWTGLSDIPRAVDGCGAPIVHLPLWAMALLYAKLSAAPEFSPIRQAMLSYPELIGGEGRVDTMLMQVSQRASREPLIAKVGADGVVAVGNNGRGLVLKIWGGSADIRNRVLVAALHQLGWLSREAYAEMGVWADLNRYNSQKRVIGHYRIDVGI